MRLSIANLFATMILTTSTWVECAGDKADGDKADAFKKCGRTIPVIIKEVFELVKDELELLQGDNNNWSDVCCEAAGLRAEIGFTWTEIGDSCGGPWINYALGSDADQFPNFLLPLLQPEQVPHTTATAATSTDPVRRVQEITSNMNDFLEANKEVAGKMGEGINAARKIMGIMLNNMSGGSAEAANADAADIEIMDEKDLMNLACNLVPEVSSTFCSDSEGGRKNRALQPGLDENIARDGFALFLLFLFSPWLLPACHCLYRKEVGCGRNDCFMDEPNAPGKVTPNPQMLDDIATAKHYWRAQFFGSSNGIPEWGTIRACNACPGESTYFDDADSPNRRDRNLRALDSKDSRDDENALAFLPVRRGGEPYEECLGYCLLHGSYDSLEGCV